MKKRILSLYDEITSAWWREKGRTSIVTNAPSISAAYIRVDLCAGSLKSEEHCLEIHAPKLFHTWSVSHSYYRNISQS